MRAYLDKKDVIEIYSEVESSFTINGEPIETFILNKNNGIIRYRCFYNVDTNKEYIIKDSFGNSANLTIRYYVKDDSFDEKYYYDGNDLGVTYHRKYSTFKLWAPLASSVYVVYEIDGTHRKEKMVKDNHGVFSITIKGNLIESLYHYEVTNNGVVESVCDPYAYSTNSNTKESAVINLSLIKDGKHIKQLPKINSVNDCIIYELSVRDYSMDNSFGVDVAGKFKAFLKHPTYNGYKIGLDHIKDLGVTHIQLMPILDFVTVNEDDIKEKYNWGYDPALYSSIEGSYSTNPNDPYCRIKEAKEMIDEIHRYGLRVTMDVVFNHTFSIDSNYNKIVPNYYYLMDENGTLSNGCFCGNDIDTTRKMVRKYLVDMSIRLVSLYHIDGLRFDLMGILDKSLINEIYNKCKAINNNFICYGEGWNMPSMLPYEKRAITQANQQMPNIMFFNDFFRDIVSGKVSGEKGYLNGNTKQFYEFSKAMRGSIEDGCYFESPTSSINYVECHDNNTLYDKLEIINKNLTVENRNRLQLLNLAATIFAIGIPFIHAGCEINRSKKGIENSYNSNDDINMIHWEDVIKYKDNVKAIKDFISIRNEFPVFRLTDRKKVLQSIDTKVSKEGIVRFLYVYNGKIIMLAFNPTGKQVNIPFNSEFTHYANTFGLIKDERLYDSFYLEAFSFHVFVK